MQNKMNSQETLKSNKVNNLFFSIFFFFYVNVSQTFTKQKNKNSYSRFIDTKIQNIIA